MTIGARNLTEGDIPTHLFALALPVVGAMLLQSVYAIIDLAFVGRLGETAVAGLSISFQVFFIILAISQIMATTALANVSQAYGAGRFAEARGAFSAIVVVATVVGAVAGVGALATADVYVATYTADGPTAEAALSYYRINCITFFSQVMLIVIGNGIRGSGDFVTPMRIMAVSVLTNLALDPLLIFGIGPFPRMELAGAAVATVISQFVGLTIYVFVLFRGADERNMRLTKPAWSRALFVQMWVRGAPAGVQFFLLSALLGIILGAMRSHGPMWTASAGGGFRVVQQTLLPMVALGSAASAVAGQNFGAMRFDRVRESTWTALRWATTYAIVVCAMLFAGARVFGLIFAEDDSLDLAATYFHWSAPLTIAFAWTFVPTYVMQALGRAVLPMMAAITRLSVLALLVFALLGPIGASPKWVFGAATLSAFVEGALDLFFMRREFERSCPTDPG